MSSYFPTLRRTFSSQFSMMLDDILTEGTSHERLMNMKDELYFLIDLVDYIDKRIDELKAVGKMPDHTTIEDAVARYQTTPNHTTLGDLMK